MPKKNLAGHYLEEVDFMIFQLKLLSNEKDWVLAAWALIIVCHFKPLDQAQVMKTMLASAFNHLVLYKPQTYLTLVS